MGRNGQISPGVAQGQDLDMLRYLGTGGFPWRLRKPLKIDGVSFCALGVVLSFCQISGGMISKREFKAGLLICLRGLKSLYKHFFSQVSFYPWEEMDFQKPRDLLSAKQVSQLS